MLIRTAGGQQRAAAGGHDLGFPETETMSEGNETMSGDERFDLVIVVGGGQRWAG